jgi:hypothetical protein
VEYRYERRGSFGFHSLMACTDGRACHPIISDPAALIQRTHTDPRQLQDAEARACWPTSLPSPTREVPVAAATLVAILATATAGGPGRARLIAAVAEWVADAPSRSGPPSAPAATPRATSPSPGRGNHPPDAHVPGRRRPGRCRRRLACRRGTFRSRGQPAAGRRVDGRTLRGAPVAGGDSRPGAPAGGDGPRKPRGAGPTPGRPVWVR